MTSAAELRQEMQEAFDMIHILEAEIDDLRKVADQKAAEARKIEHSSGDEQVRTAPEDAFRAFEPKYDVRPYVLPFGREYPMWNPRDVENAPFSGKSWLAGMTAIICSRTDEERSRPSRLIFTSSNGVPDEHDKIGQRFEARHDQTGKRLGDYRIDGLVIYSGEGEVLRIVGDVPNVKFHMNTYK